MATSCSKYNIGLRNTTTQLVPVGGLISMGGTYRNFSRVINGIDTFRADGESLRLQQQGIYLITATLIGTGTEAGDLTAQVLENGEPITVLATETITTPDTEVHTLTINYLAKVDNSCIMGCNVTVGKTITLQNIGVEATYTYVGLTAVKL